MYTTSQEAFQDDAVHFGGVEEEKKLREAGVQMTIQRHRASHWKDAVILSRGEMEWRKSVKGPALPLLGHDKFG